MKYERYEVLAASKDLLEFTFFSEGPKGRIQKVIQFKQTDEEDFYNLAFGDLREDGSFDDHVKNNNKDRNKILATVAAAVYEFTARNPDKYVLFTGSTPERTRLYRMAIANNLGELSVDYNVFGLFAAGGSFLVQDFARGTEYAGFMIRRKIV